MDCGCEYCTETLCDVEAELKKHPAVIDVAFDRVVHITTTIDSETAREEIYKLEAALLKKYQIKMDFRVIVEKK